MNFYYYLVFFHKVLKNQYKEKCTRTLSAYIISLLNVKKMIVEEPFTFSFSNWWRSCLQLHLFHIKHINKILKENNILLFYFDKSE